MTEEKEIESGELVVIKEVDIPALFKKDGCDHIIEGLEKKAAEFEGDISTKKGRDEIKSFARKFSTSKIYIDKLGKVLTDKYRDKIKPIQAERNKIEACCDKLRDEIRKPLTDWEDAEKERVAKHEQNIQTINDYLNVEVENSSHAKDLLDGMKAFDTGDVFEEFELAATKAKEAALIQLEAKFIVLQNTEKEKAESDRLEKKRLEKEQKEREKKIAEDAAEAARIETEEKGKAEAEKKELEEKEKREKLEKETLQAQLDKEKAEREKKEAEELAEKEKKEAAELAEKDKEAAIEEERKKVADQTKADKEAEEKRQDNKKHRNKIIKQITEDLKKWNLGNVKFCLDDKAVQSLIDTLIDGDIRNVEVKF